MLITANKNFMNELNGNIFLSEFGTNKTYKIMNVKYNSDNGNYDVYVKECEKQLTKTDYIPFDDHSKKLVKRHTYQYVTKGNNRKYKKRFFITEDLFDGLAYEIVE